MSRPPIPRRTVRRTVGIVAAMMLAATGLQGGSMVAGAVADEAPEQLWAANRRVNVMRQVGDYIYLGGRFDRLGPVSGHAVILDEDTGEVVDSPLHVNGVVNTAIPDGSGGWYVGGDFTHVNGVARRNLVRIDSSGGLVPFAPDPNGPVQDLLLDSSRNRLLVAGGFGYIGDRVQQGLAALDPATGQAQYGFDGRVNGWVNSIALSPDRTILAVGGSFTHASGQKRNNLVRLDAHSGEAFSQTNVDGFVRTVAFSPDGLRLYAGGAFQNASLIPSKFFATFSAITGLIDPTFRVTPNAEVFDIDVAGNGVIHLGGYFTKLKKVDRRFAGAVDPTGTIEDWNPNPDWAVHRIRLDGAEQRVFLSGYFNFVGGTESRSTAIVKRHGYGELLSDYDITANDAAFVSASAAGGRVLVGGAFTSVKSHFQHFLARLHADTGELDLTWRPWVNHEVLALEVWGDMLYISGTFDTVNGEARPGAAALNIDGGWLTGWNPRPKGGVIMAMAVDDRGVYLGGDFARIRDNNLGANLARVDHDTGQFQSLFLPKPNRPVHSLAIDRNTGLIYVGGEFGLIGGKFREKIASLNPNLGIAGPFNPSAKYTVRTLEAANGRIFGGVSGPGGNFNANAVFAWDPASGDEIWRVVFGGDPQDLEMSRDGSTLYVGGHFVNSEYPVWRLQKEIAAIDAWSGALLDFDPKVFSYVDGVFALDDTERGLLIGGDIDRLGDDVHGNIARLPEGAG